MARTLFFIEAILLVLGSSIFSAFSSRPLSTFVVPVVAAMLIPVFSLMAIWSPRAVLRAFRHAFSAGRPGSGARESIAILESLPGFAGLGAAAGAVGAVIVTLGGLSTGARPLDAAFQSLAFALFGILYFLAARILGGTADRRWSLPDNRVVASSIDAFARKYGLSPREVEVATELVRGRTYREIADSLFISEKTVKTHVSHVYEKTGCPNKVSLVLLQKAETDDSYERPMAQKD